ncbi:hypothetical protein [Brasilonema sennae]
MKNTDKNITNNIKNDVPVAGTDFFADSEDFLNELTDSELVQVRGGNSGLSVVTCDRNGTNGQSGLSLVLCD